MLYGAVQSWALREERRRQRLQAMPAILIAVMLWCVNWFQDRFVVRLSLILAEVACVVPVEGE